MLKAKYRESFDFAHIRIGMFFSKFGLTPNGWTILSLLPAFIGLVFLYKQMLLWGLVFFVASAFIDIVDGNVARVTKSVSNLGAFIDGVIDRYVEFALYIGLWFYLRNGPEVILPVGFWMIFLIFGSLMPSFITAYADHRKVISDEEKLRNIGGFVERFERLALLYIGMFLGIYSVIYLVYAVILVGLLSNLTALHRIFEVVRNS
ncbi:MAG: CDP-alcohol phosphatidyltransferase family protein [Candidatus Altiarchaeota archaeon]|nr:CDP-alcohol phosphatidyltransferase family protein [Candidatus Altiarchaeota archaeon]